MQIRFVRASSRCCSSRLESPSPVNDGGSVTACTTTVRLGHTSLYHHGTAGSYQLVPPRYGWLLCGVGTPPQSFAPTCVGCLVPPTGLPIVVCHYHRWTSAAVQFVKISAYNREAGVRFLPACHDVRHWLRQSVFMPPHWRARGPTPWWCGHFLLTSFDITLIWDTCYLNTSWQMFPISRPPRMADSMRMK